MSNRRGRLFGGATHILAALLILVLIVPAARGGQASDRERPPLQLVRARKGDTPQTLARRYLKAASKGWMIAEYNGKDAFSEGEAVVIPGGDFRPGGLSPGGIQVVPVVAYGDIGDTNAKTNRASRISRSAFHEQIRCLSDTGFIAVSPDRLVEFMAFTAQLPRRSVLITADTESQTFYEDAAPILKAFGMKATVFIAPGRVGEKGTMTWDQIRALSKEGFTIGCRGSYGRSLTRRKRGQSFKENFSWIESELQQGKKKVEAELGEPCRFLAYPEGRSDNLIAAMAANLGFAAAFNRSPGGTPFYADRFAIHRNIVDRRTDLDRFSDLLATTIVVDLK
ncbi:polysaccharide deacetylase family protein [uncultured Desulfosarcina sp.]|uniref:polysaccharide deacetylase family protein n=1 Tax=uncultured Desulfosarcina sp. TaxID=218289 RepID=UPI0029C7C115|nr:polysaccharide deacetylase family protein [uncultured Desulfosarcina sp.]